MALEFGGFGNTNRAEGGGASLLEIGLCKVEPANTKLWHVLLLMKYEYKTKLNKKTKKR